MAEGVGGEILARRMNVAGDPHGLVVVIGLSLNDGETVPNGKVSLLCESGHGQSPSVTQRGARASEVEGEDKVKVGVGPAVVANNKAAGPVSDDPLSGFHGAGSVGKVEKFSEVGDFGNNVNIENQNAVGVGEGEDSSAITHRPFDKVANGDLVNIGGGDGPAKDDPKIPGSVQQANKRPGAIWEVISQG